MARARNIKPGIMENEELAELDPLARLLFIYLWMLADREGRLEDRPKRIKAKALAYDAADADKLLDDLQRAGFIVRYEERGIRCIQIVTFSKHQKPHSNETQSELPSWNGELPTKVESSFDQGDEECERGDEALGPCISDCHDSLIDRLPVVPDGTSAPSEKISLNADGRWTDIPDRLVATWKEAYPALSLDAELSKAAAWIIANPKNKKSNYARFLTNWLSRAQDKAPSVRRGESPPRNFQDRNDATIAALTGRDRTYEPDDRTIDV